MTEKKLKTKKHENLIAIIRISGLVNVNRFIEDTLYRLKLRRKYSCVLVHPTKDILGMIKKIRYHVAYGEINKETLIELIDSRARIIGSTSKNVEKSKIDSEKTASELIAGKRLGELGLKPFFRLHPPRKGINSKLQYPKGVLGNNKEDINKLIERML